MAGLMRDLNLERKGVKKTTLNMSGVEWMLDASTMTLTLTVHPKPRKFGLHGPWVGGGL